MEHISASLPFSFVKWWIESTNQPQYLQPPPLSLYVSQSQILSSLSFETGVSQSWIYHSIPLKKKLARDLLIVSARHSHACKIIGLEDKNNILLVAWIFSGFLYTSARGACTTVMIFFSFNSLSSSFKFISFIYVSFFQKYLTTQTQLTKRKFLCFTPFMPQFPWTWPGSLIFPKTFLTVLKGYTVVL